MLIRATRICTDLKSGLILAFLLFPVSVLAQQVADTEYKPALRKPAFAEGTGPIVFVDEAHGNSHTASGSYLPFANLLRRDGYVVEPLPMSLDTAPLGMAGIVVIANALGRQQGAQLTKPVRSAFNAREIEAVYHWVSGGGSLLLIVDHFPGPDAAKDLAERFGVHFDNGIALQGKHPGLLHFQRGDRSLAVHPVTRGRTKRERVDSVASFTGAAFQIDQGTALLTFVEDNSFTAIPKALGGPGWDHPRRSIKGWLQGAALRIGKGRVAVFGEAAMFSAQLAGPELDPMGMNHPRAKQNAQFLLNVTHWLSGLLDRPTQAKAPRAP